jgi:hypothetical protein
MPHTFNFLIIDTYYRKFLKSLYAKNPELFEKDYAEQIEFIMNQCFSTADFYSKNLIRQGCYGEEIIANNEILQERWAVENNLRIKGSFFARSLRLLPFRKRFLFNRRGLLRILEAQIKKSRPDILYVQDLFFCPPDFLVAMKKYVKLVVGQIACPLPPLDYLKPYDLILTSFPHFVEKFKKLGIPSEYFKIAFELSVLEKVGSHESKYLCTFVGGISSAHKKGTELLEGLARNVEIDFFGYGVKTLNKNSPIILRHHGEVWGLDMYRVLLSSRITINRHIDVAENYANNMRLYEATGCGALLVTDFKENLSEIFVPDKEVITYGCAEEATEKINYYLNHEKERKEVALAGQNRTLSEHTYFNRMGELIEIMGKYV